MRASGSWDNFEGRNQGEDEPNSSFNRMTAPNSSINAVAGSLQPQLQAQQAISAEEILDTITSRANSHANNYEDDELYENDDYDRPEDMGTGMGSFTSEQPTMEQIQRVYYTRGLQELESLQLIDLSTLANWKLSSAKQDYGLEQLREDSPDAYWQSDGSNGNNNANSSGNAIANNQLSHPHCITIQFSKKVSIERVSIFTNFSADESYTPARIQILAGNSDGWDMSEVCTLSFNKPVGWSHIIFNAIRSDGVLRCFCIKLLILSNHQDGKDTRIRAVRCFGKKPTNKKSLASGNLRGSWNTDILKDLSMNSGMSSFSGILLNSHVFQNLKTPSVEMKNAVMSEESSKADTNDSQLDEETDKVLTNVSDVIGFNTGFQTLQLKSTSSIR